MQLFGLGIQLVPPAEQGHQLLQLFLIVGLIYERTHTREIARFSGLAHVMPVYAVLFAIIMLSSLGLPTLNGFIGEFLVMTGTFQVNPTYAYFAVWGIVLAAAYLLNFSPKEAAAIGILQLLSKLFGFYSITIKRCML